ncbi:hypothetical protein L9F63_001404, partial [Diploptera punctata]
NSGSPVIGKVRDYAVKIGINPESEPHLLHFARDGLMQALPTGWKPCYDEELQSWYYFNFRSGESRWEHPLDDVYRNLVRKVRSESISSAGEEDSKTSAKEDLRSYEEAAPSTQDSMQPATHTLSSLKGGTGLKKGHIQLAPLRKSPVLSPLATPNSASPKKLEASPLSSPAGSKSPTGSLKMNSAASDSDAPRPIATRVELGGARIDIDKMDMGSLVKKSEEQAISRKERLLSAQEKHPRGMTGRGELTLTGGGSMFLKSRQQKQESTSASSPSPGMEISPTSDGFSGIVEVISSKDDENPPKSILRDQQRPSSGGKPLWDVDPREMSSEEKQLWRRQELEEERKSVRFNLEQELDICFNVSDPSEQEEEEEGEDWNSDEEDPDEERVIAGIKVSDILNLMDASDLEEVSTGLEPFEKTDMQHTSSLVSNVTPSSEDMVFKELTDEVSEKNSHDVKSEGDEKMIDKTVEIDRQVYQERLTKEIQKLEEENEKALLKHKEILAQRLEESVKQLESEQQSSLEILRSQLAKQEVENEEKLRSQYEEKVAALESDLKAQQENQEKSIRENMEASLQELRDTLAAERESQIQALQLEQEEIRTRQVAEFKQKLEDDRVRLECETAEQVAVLEQQLADKLEEERARLESAHTQHIRELTELNKEEIEATKIRLQEELAAHRDEIQRDHAKEIETIDAELLEVMDKERAAKLLELDEAKKRSESFEKLKKEMGTRTGTEETGTDC